MTAILDLDAPPASAPAPARRLLDVPVAKFSIAVLVGAVVATAAAVAAFTIPARLATAPVAAPPLLMFSATGDRPTATVWYADGTHGEASEALAGPWRPDRPVRMVTVAATGECSITVDERLAVTEVAPANRLAVCVWTAPR